MKFVIEKAKVQQAIILAYKDTNRKKSITCGQNMKKIIVSKAYENLLRFELYKIESDVYLEQVKAYTNYLFACTFKLTHELLGKQREILQNIEKEYDLIVNILQHIHPFSERGEKIIFVKNNFMKISEENSSETSYSYSYKYEKPKKIQKSTGEIVDLDEMFSRRYFFEKHIFQGITLRNYEYIPEYKSRNRRFEMIISEEACPIRIYYATGEGSGYTDSEYNDSMRREEWITYLRDLKGLKGIIECYKQSGGY